MIQLFLGLLAIGLIFVKEGLYHKRVKKKLIDLEIESKKGFYSTRYAKDLKVFRKEFPKNSIFIVMILKSLDFVSFLLISLLFLWFFLESF